MSPFDDAAPRAAAGRATPDVVLVEPYLAGTSSAAAGAVLAEVRHRILPLGVGRAEPRRYGSTDEHTATHGLDAGSVRRRITAFLR
ncbi:hypothetical protein ACWDYJ_20910 [Streptomyces sp. NPDC003042]